MQSRDPAIHTVLTSDDVLGPSSGGTAWTTKKFHDANPKRYRAVLDAMQEASVFIAGHPKETVAFYAADTKIKIDTDMMKKLLADPRFKYAMTSRATLRWADFMHKGGASRWRQASWKDLIWPEIYDLDGG